MRYKFVNVYQKNRKGKPWYGIASYKDENGKQKLKTKTFPKAKGKREAEKLALEWVNAINQSAEEETVKPEDTVEEVCTRYYESQSRKHLIEDSTYLSHTTRAKTYIYPYIGTLGFYSLERRDLEKWITELHNKGYTQNTIHSAFLVLNKVYINAMKIELITKNPCSLVSVPSGKPRKSYMTDTQMNNFLVAVWLEYDDDNHRHLLIAYLLAYYCGLRRGEICGLRFRDLDFERGLLTVSSAVSIREGGQYLKGPKSESSYRTFPVPKQLLKLLKDYKEEIEAEDNWFVCGNGEEHLGVIQFNVHFKELADKYELVDAYGKKLTPHSLRHNVGYSGVRSGMDVGALSRILGHKDMLTTLNVYSDTSPDAVKVGMDKLSSFFKKRDLDE